MTADPVYPAFEADALEGWALVEESVETLFQLSAMTVRGVTRRYEDEDLRVAVREATGGDIDREWRFVAATRLDFSPSLPSGTVPSLILPAVRSEANRTFRKRFEERGVVNLTRHSGERMRVRSGNRARLTCYDGVDTVAGGVPVTGWVGAWHDGTDFFVVTGGYPAGPLEESLDVESDDDALSLTGKQARSELLELFRGVH